MNPTRSWALLALFVPALACSGSVVGANGADGGDGHDAGGGHDGGGPHKDGSTGPDGGGSDATTGPDAGGPPPTVLAPGKDLVVWGVTSDGYAIYSQATSAPTLFAVSLSGGSPQQIAATGSASFYTLVQGKLLLLYTGFQNDGSATLQVWSSAGGLHGFGPVFPLYASGYTPTAIVSPDSSEILYFKNYSSSLQTADAYVAHPDGSGATLLHAAVPGLAASGASCPPEAMFEAGSVVLSYCTSTTTFVGNVFSYSGPSWTEVPVATGTYTYVNTDPTGANLVLHDPTNGIEVVPLSGGTPVPIDPAGEYALVTSDGKTVVYTTSSDGLYKSSLASPNPVSLVPAGAVGLLALSPVDSTALLFANYDQTTYLTDLFAASTEAAGSLSPLDASATSGFLQGSAFTNDGSHVVYYDAFSYTSLKGTLKVSATKGGSATTLSSASNTAWASGPSKVVFEDNFAVPVGSSFATLDIKVADTASGGVPTTVAVHANGPQYTAGFYLNPAGDSVVFASEAGVSLVKVP